MAGADDDRELPAREATTFISSSTVESATLTESIQRLPPPSSPSQLDDDSEDEDNNLDSEDKRRLKDEEEEEEEVALMMRGIASANSSSDDDLDLPPPDLLSDDLTISSDEFDELVEKESDGEKVDQSDDGVLPHSSSIEEGEDGEEEDGFEAPPMMLSDSSLESLDDHLLSEGEEDDDIYVYISFNFMTEYFTNIMIFI